MIGLVSRRQCDKLQSVFASFQERFSGLFAVLPWPRTLPIYWQVALLAVVLQIGAPGCGADSCEEARPKAEPEISVEALARKAKQSVGSHFPLRS